MISSLLEIKKKKKKRKKRQLKSSKSKAQSKTSKSGRPRTGKSQHAQPLFKYTTNTKNIETFEEAMTDKQSLQEMASLPLMQGKCVQLQMLPTPPKSKKPQVKLSLHSRSQKGIKVNVLEVKSLASVDAKLYQRLSDQYSGKDGGSHTYHSKGGTKSSNHTRCPTSANIPNPTFDLPSTSKSHSQLEVLLSKDGSGSPYIDPGIKVVDTSGRHRVTKVYQSDKQSGTMKELGVEFPCAPPATPLPGKYINRLV